MIFNSRDWMAPAVMILSALAFIFLLAGCETVGYLHERNEPIVIPVGKPTESSLIYGTDRTMWKCGDGVFRHCVQVESEWEGKI